MDEEFWGRTDRFSADAPPKSPPVYARLLTDSTSVPSHPRILGAITDTNFSDVGIYSFTPQTDAKEKASNHDDNESVGMSALLEPDEPKVEPENDMEVEMVMVDLKRFEKRMLSLVKMTPAFPLVKAALKEHFRLIVGHLKKADTRQSRLNNLQSSIDRLRAANSESLVQLKKVKMLANTYKSQLDGLRAKLAVRDKELKEERFNYGHNLLMVREIVVQHGIHPELLHDFVPEDLRRYDENVKEQQKKRKVFRQLLRRMYQVLLYQNGLYMKRVLQSVNSKLHEVYNRLAGPERLINKAFQVLLRERYERRLHTEAYEKMLRHELDDEAQERYRRKATRHSRGNTAELLPAKVAAATDSLIYKGDAAARKSRKLESISVLGSVLGRKASGDVESAPEPVSDADAKPDTEEKAPVLHTLELDTSAHSREVSFGSSFVPHILAGSQDEKPDQRERKQPAIVSPTPSSRLSRFKAGRVPRNELARWVDEGVKYNVREAENSDDQAFKACRVACMIERSIEVVRCFQALRTTQNLYVLAVRNAMNDYRSNVSKEKTKTRGGQSSIEEAKVQRKFEKQWMRAYEDAFKRCYVALHRSLLRLYVLYDPQYGRNTLKSAVEEERKSEDVDGHVRALLPALPPAEPSMFASNLLSNVGFLVGNTHKSVYVSQVHMGNAESTGHTALLGLLPPPFQTSTPVLGTFQSDISWKIAPPFMDIPVDSEPVADVSVSGRRKKKGGGKGSSGMNIAVQTTPLLNPPLCSLLSSCPPPSLSDAAYLVDLGQNLPGDHPHKSAHPVMRTSITTSKPDSSFWTRNSIDSVNIDSPTSPALPHPLLPVVDPDLHSSPVPSPKKTKKRSKKERTKSISRRTKSSTPKNKRRPRSTRRRSSRSISQTTVEQDVDSQVIEDEEPASERQPSLIGSHTEQELTESLFPEGSAIVEVKEHDGSLARFEYRRGMLRSISSESTGGWEATEDVGLGLSNSLDASDMPPDLLESRPDSQPDDAQPAEPTSNAGSLLRRVSPKHASQHSRQRSSMQAEQISSLVDALGSVTEEALVSRPESLRQPEDTPATDDMQSDLVPSAGSAALSSETLAFKRELVRQRNRGPPLSTRPYNPGLVRPMRINLGAAKTANGRSRQQQRTPLSVRRMLRYAEQRSESRRKEVERMEELSRQELLKVLMAADLLDQRDALDPQELKQLETDQELTELIQCPADLDE